MASFSSLPIELVHQILEFLGPRWFRADVSRLCICRGWYKVAHDLLIRTMVLFPRNLAALQRRKHDDFYTHIWDDVRDLRISIFDASNGISRHAASVFEHWDQNFEFPRGAMFIPYPVQRPSIMHQNLRGDLISLIDQVPNFKKLEALRLRVIDGAGAADFERSRQSTGLYPYHHLLRGLQDLAVSMPERLTTLELSLDNNAFAYGSGVCLHTCPIIARFLPKLKNFAFHTESTCPEAITLPDDGSMIGLERLIVNLNPGADSHRHDRGHWNGCLPVRPHNRRLYSLQKNEIVRAAKSLVHRMKDPKLARLIFGIGPSSLDVVSVDCITGNEMLLLEGTRLTEDGEIIENAADERSAYSGSWNHPVPVLG